MERIERERVERERVERESGPSRRQKKKKKTVRFVAPVITSIEYYQKHSWVGTDRYRLRLLIKEGSIDIYLSLIATSSPVLILVPYI